MKGLLIFLVKFYRLVISPMLGPRCRYYPTCSEYALIALQHHGAWKGSILATKRIFRCHPGCQGGFDPVPGVPLEDGSQTQETETSDSEENQDAHR
ncbi:membrane protein insertion efficiency factor YidD [Reinekea thalattae]|uniref:Putative membrane protein insertion efficiency factor n=1 Tax=Reinekea thalattae TaxID=2593301 RepID=A0A5C8Z1S3_9GAMM|nr:membrane protein insertion efficiency factor YidD [Reinekea thalattae]TXR52102.1 membrane protein insertion efficiency factor YidD [Reinekea thalattae]